MIEVDDEMLLRNAQEAARQAYAPYSGFPVGAALLSSSGRIFTGCNIENASYGLTVCAERVALFNAISSGEYEFVKLALWATVPCWPCGACLQCLAEFAPGLQILRRGDGQRVEAKNLAELFPVAFRLEGSF
jgi:cytidine deaminase